MRIHVTSVMLLPLLCSSMAFAVSRDECQSAFHDSSAYQSCGSLFTAKDVGGKCGIRVYCKAPDGSEVENGTMGAATNPHGDDAWKKDPRGEETSYSTEGLLQFSVSDLKRLVNCNGHLKVGAC